MKFIYFANPSCFACWPSGFFCLTHSLYIQAYMPLKSYFEYLGVPHLMRNPVQEGGRELNQAWGMGLGLGSGSSHSWQLGNLTSGDCMWVEGDALTPKNPNCNAFCCQKLFAFV